MRNMSRTGRSRTIPSGPAPRPSTRALTRTQMYRPQIGLKLGMEKKLIPSGAILVDDLGGYLIDDDGVAIVI